MDIHSFIFRTAVGVGIAITLYIITVLSVLVFGKMEKDENGRLIIDVNSWHFKVAYPLKRKKEEFLKKLEVQGFGLCRYCLKLWVMAFIGWELFAVFMLCAFIFGSLFYVVENLMLIVGAVTLFVFGKYYPKSNWYLPWNFMEHNFNDTVRTRNSSEIEFFKIKTSYGKQFLFRPAYVLLPGFYFYALYYSNSVMISSFSVVSLINYFVLAVITTAILVLLIIELIVLLKKVPKSGTSLLQELEVTRYIIDGFCPKMRVITHLPDDQNPKL